MGESTFGKGLVQRVIRSRIGISAVAVTTAKYYTPSGRLIQRDYSDLDDYFLETDDAPPAPEETQTKPHEVRHTDSGRVVYGGGGITPDHIVKARRASGFLSRILRENAIFDFVIRYLATHPKLEGDFVANDAVLEDFRKFLETRKTTFTDEELKTNREDLTLRIRAQVARVRQGAEAESRVLAEGDVQVQKALGVFDEAVQLQKDGRSAGDRRTRESPAASSSLSEASGGERSRMSSSFPPTPSRWKRRSVSILRAGSRCRIRSRSRSAQRVRVAVAGSHVGLSSAGFPCGTGARQPRALPELREPVPTPKEIGSARGAC